MNPEKKLALSNGRGLIFIATNSFFCVNNLFFFSLSLLYTRWTSILIASNVGAMHSTYPLKNPVKIAMIDTHDEQYESTIFQWTNSRKIPARRVVLSAILFVLLWGYMRSGRSSLQGANSIRAEHIPRIVHLVQLKPNDDADLHFSFQSFLCIFTAYHYIKPTTIYIHTDFTPADISHAKQHGSSWTRRVLAAFPTTLKLNPVVAPTNVSESGLRLDRIEHKSDFVRMEQVHRHGGVYLDWDVLTLRSPEPLLTSGFQAIVGRQVDDNINNGCFLAAPGAALTQLMSEEMPRVFSGEWQAHSTGLITPIAERIAWVPREVLIMDHKAFAPTSWYDDSAAGLFGEHDGSRVGLADGVQVNDDLLVDPVLRWRNRTEGKEWEMDFSQTYFLHAFKSMWGPVPGFHGVSLPYILRRESNYALAAYSAVMEGIRQGIIDGEDESL